VLLDDIHTIKEAHMRTKASKRIAVFTSGMCVVATVGLAGCVSPGPAPSSSWVNPPWVAQQAAEREEYRSQLQSCLDGKGWHVTVDLNGGIAEGFTDKAEMARVSDDFTACRVSMGYSPYGTPQTLDDLKLNYSQLLDTRACLVARGLDMAPPPSEDAWIEGTQANTYVWHPYYDPAFTALSMDEQNALEALCPQPWSTK